MLDLRGPAALWSRVVARPKLAKALAADRELSDELVQLWIVDFGADERPECRDDRGGRAVLVLVAVAEPRVKEGDAHEVFARGVVGGKRSRKRIRGEHVHVAAVDVGGRLMPGRDQLEDPGGHSLRPRIATPGPPPPAAHGRRRKTVKVRGCVVIELECSGKRVEHLR